MKQKIFKLASLVAINRDLDGTKPGCEQPGYFADYDLLRNEFPLLVHYEKLSQGKRHLAGYYREKMENEIAEVSRKIISDIKLSEQLKINSPKTYLKIYDKSQEHCL